MLRTTLSASAVVLLALAACAPAPAGHEPAVSARHPDFTLPNIADGKPVSLSNFRGKKVLLIQFASW
jgi:hypothetical protein